MDVSVIYSEKTRMCESRTPRIHMATHSTRHLEIKMKRLIMAVIYRHPYSSNQNPEMRALLLDNSSRNGYGVSPSPDKLFDKEDLNTLASEGIKKVDIIMIKLVKVLQIRSEDAGYMMAYLPRLAVFNCYLKELQSIRSY